MLCKNLLSNLLFSAVFVPASFGVIVFQDDFNEGSVGTPTQPTPEIGSAWSGKAYTSNGSVLDTRTDNQTMSATFAGGAALGAGEVLTLSFTVTDGSFSASAPAVVFALKQGSSDVASVGKLGSSTAWGTNPNDGQDKIVSNTTTLSNPTTIVYTYTYDTKAFSMTVNGTSVATGTDAIEDNAAINGIGLYVSDNTAGSYLLIDSVSVDISAVPEPATTAALLGLGALGVVLYRRRKR